MTNAKMINFWRTSTDMSAKFMKTPDLLVDCFACVTMVRRD